MDNRFYFLEYELVLDQGDVLKYPLQIHSKNLNLIIPENEKPDWAKLNYNRCDCCTIDSTTCTFCPAALNMIEFIEKSKQYNSTEMCQAICKTPQVTIHISEKMMIQDALARILFIMLVASDCPHMSLCKPLIKYSTPFVSINESIFNVSSALIIGHFFKNNAPDRINIAFEDIISTLDDIQLVYHGLFSRIKDVSNRDANNNALMVIDSLHQIVTMEITEGLKCLGNTFKAWVD